MIVPRAPPLHGPLRATASTQQTCTPPASTLTASHPLPVPQADVQLIKRLIREAKASGFDSGSTKSQGSPH